MDSRFRGNDEWGAGDDGWAFEERASSLACLPKPLLSSSLAAAMRCWGPKTLSSPCMTLIRKRTTETPSSVDSRIFFASAMSNSDSSDGPELFLLRDGSGGLLRMKSIASSRPYLVSSLAASSLWQILKSGRSSVMTSMRKSMTVSPLSVLAWIL